MLNATSAKKHVRAIVATCGIEPHVAAWASGTLFGSVSTSTNTSHVLPPTLTKMAKVQYAQTAQLSDGHSEGITCVVFNPEGSLLATAGLDGAVCLWNTTTWCLLDIYYSKTPVTALAWYTDTAVVCGLKDGNLCSLIKADGAVSGASR